MLFGFREERVWRRSLREGKEGNEGKEGREGKAGTAGKAGSWQAGSNRKNKWRVRVKMFGYNNVYLDAPFIDPAAKIS
jgi:hypothetical protein